MYDGSDKVLRFFFHAQDQIQMPSEMLVEDIEKIAVNEVGLFLG